MFRKGLFSINKKNNFCSISCFSHILRLYGQLGLKFYAFVKTLLLFYFHLNFELLLIFKNIELNTLKLKFPLCIGIFTDVEHLQQTIKI